MTEAINAEKGPLENENFESVQERAKALADIINDFETNIEPAIQTHLNNSEVIFKTEGGYDDILKKQSLIPLMQRLGNFRTEVYEIANKYHESNGVFLGNLPGEITELEARLTAAPDVRYSYEAQIAKHGGKKENIPGNQGLDTWEHTKEALVKFKGLMRGVASAIDFLGAPKKY